MHCMLLVAGSISQKTLFLLHCSSWWLLLANKWPPPVIRGVPITKLQTKDLIQKSTWLKDQLLFPFYCCVAELLRCVKLLHRYLEDTVAVWWWTLSKQASSQQASSKLQASSQARSSLTRYALLLFLSPFYSFHLPSKKKIYLSPTDRPEGSPVDIPYKENN